MKIWSSSRFYTWSESMLFYLCLSYAKTNNNNKNWNPHNETILVVFIFFPVIDWGKTVGCCFRWTRLDFISCKPVALAASNRKIPQNFPLFSFDIETYLFHVPETMQNSIISGIFRIRLQSK